MGTKKNRSITNLCAFMLAATLIVAGCGGGGGGGEDPPMMPEPTAQERCEAGGGRYNADGSCTSAADLAIEAEAAAITKAIADAKAAADALTAESSNEDVAAAEALVTAAHEAITGAEHASASETAASLEALGAVRTTVATAKEAVAQRIQDEMELAERVMQQKAALMTAAAAIDTSDLSTAEAIAAANTAIAALQAALDAAVDVSDDDKAMYQSQLDAAGEAVRMAQTGLDTAGRQMAQREAISTAVTAARTAVGMVDDDATDAQVTAADNAIAALKAAIDGAADLPEGDADVASAQGTLTTLEGQLASAKQSRMAAMDEADRAAREAMAATARKLYAGISMPTATDTDTADTPDATGTRFAQHAADGPNAGDIEVAIGAAANVFLSEDKDAMIADNHGWEGKRYTRTTPAAEGMYEAVVYSNVGAPIQGRKFGNAEPGTGDNRAYEYNLTNGVLTNPDDSAFTLVDSRIAFTGVTRTAGTETFRLPSPNLGGLTVINIPGSYHGVSGSYSCTPAAGTTSCSAAVAAQGFTLSTGDMWTFRPSNAEARVTDAPDTNYASYGWWIHKAANNGDFTASAFVAIRGAVTDASGLDLLNGTATYVGGAAGKYALRSTTGGMNDAGHFTARATLNADFTNNTTNNAITGTIDMFIGADGESRDWSVKLNGSAIGNTGVIGDATDGTEWTIGGTAAADSGNWTGALRNNGTDLVPQIATGTFYTTYGEAGKMVGAFGANKQ